MQNNIIEGFRLSPQQKHLWLLQQDDESGCYRSGCAVLIEGELDKKGLSAALRNVVSRHEILRTTFLRLPGMELPLQVISQEGSIRVDEHCLSGCDAPEQEARLRALLEEARAAAGEEPSLHFALATISSNKHLLIVSTPALCMDAASLRNMAREISLSYAACLNQEELIEQPVQYADISELLTDLLEAEDTETGREYWQKHPRPAFPGLRLPFETQTVTERRFEPRLLSWTIEAELVAKANELAGENNSSLMIVLLTCWQAVLRRLAGEQEMVIGVAHDGRDHEMLAEAFGLIEKYLPLRSSHDKEPRIVELLKQNEESLSELGKWQEYFAWEYLGGATDGIAAAPFLPFSFEFNESKKYFAGGAEFSVYRLYSCTDRFKLKLSCLRRGDHVIADLHYDSALFKTKDIERLAGYFRRLLEGFVESPQESANKLRILSEEELHEQLVVWNETKTPYPTHSLTHHLFELQAARSPLSPALCFDHLPLSYHQLNHRANQLAHFLLHLHLGPEHRVALLLDRSPEMVIALLAILKAGAAFIPLDPLAPPALLAFYLSDTRPHSIITQEKFLHSLPPDSQLSTLCCIDRDRHLLNSFSTENPRVDISADNLSYIIYTSGSTGTPKGAMNTHRGLLNRLLWMQDCYQLTSSDRVLQKTPYTFDVSVWEFFWPLIIGARLVIARPEGHRDSSYLVELIEREEVTVLHFVPSMLQQFLEEEAIGERCRSVRQVISSGEALTGQLAARFRRRMGARLDNLYGPTEASIDVTFWESKEEEEEEAGGGSVPIGRAIANTQIYILDREMEAVPVGVSGELYIGGEGVGRGYWERAEMTAERFVPHPFSEVGGERLYRTGDVARYRSDGVIEYVGRLDHQVKVRGLRIELGEIEAVVSEQEGVKEAVVVVREEKAGDKRLVAYVVAEQGSALEASQLRKLLKERLPEYMIPAAFVLLEALPLTPNGKIDRQALPAPKVSRADVGAHYVAPRTVIEKQLAEVWAGVLGIERVGVNDNFFALGGDSILSTQIVTRANRVGVRITPRQMFQHQTIAELASVANAQDLGIEQGLVTGAVPLTPIQHFFFEQNLPEPHHFNQSLLLEIRHPLDLGLFEQVLQYLLLHHDALRLRFTRKEAGWDQVNLEAEPNNIFSRIDLSDVAHIEQAAAIEAAATQAQSSLNLSEGPLLRVSFFDLGPRRAARLLIVIHHLAVDGVSWRILLEDLQTAYGQLKQGAAINLPLKTTSFRQWAQRLVAYAASPALSAERSYWLSAAAKALKPLPVDHTGGANTQASAQIVTGLLSAEETRALLQEVPSVYHTQINDVLLTAVVQAFAQWTGDRGLCVEMEGHGREELFDDLDLSRTVGWFTTLFPVELKLPEKAGAGEALKAVKEQLRGVPQRGIGYGLLRYLSPDEEVREALRRRAAAEVRFNYLGQFDQVSRQPAVGALTGSESSPFGVAHESSGPNFSLLGRRTHLIDIIGSITGGQLRVTWVYSENVHRRQTIKELAEAFDEALRALIRHCQCEEAGALTPSDFPLAKLNQRKLDDLLERISWAK